MMISKKVSAFVTGLVLGGSLTAAESIVLRSGLPVPVHKEYRPGVTQAPMPVLAGRTERPMRYGTDAGGFVITNGVERFNRPLYIGHDGARLDAGDRPEFVFYLPGKGGVLRLGLAAGKETKWLLSADVVTAVYREGRMSYQIRDRLLGDGQLLVEAVPAAGMAAALVRVGFKGRAPVELVWAYGGATGSKDFRGDIGYADVAGLYGLRKDDCKDTAFTLSTNSFVLQRGKMVITGAVSGGGCMQLADAAQWDDAKDLLGSKSGEKPVVAGRVKLEEKEPFLIGLACGKTEALNAGGLGDLFARSVAEKRAIAEQVKVETPDSYVNAAVPALCVAGDALWDGGKWYMHGLVAWRVPLFGWRCPYTGDALGWPERSRQHVLSSLGSQIVQASADQIPVNVKSDGYLSNKHYDMNLPVMDVLFRHLLWTGDLEFAKKTFPNIKRHLAWEKRCFDRGGLYEAYAAIWASDALQYSGGGAAHSTAYNEYHNRMAARVARLLGEDPVPYEAEAARIHAAMQKELWLQDRGTYAESRDTLGLKLAHPAAALWTMYHSIDSEVPDPFQAWQLARYVETQLPRIPVHGPGVPEGDWAVQPLTDWMPYEWSINNVAAEENYHTALACWQAGRPEQAWRLFMGTALENMCRGICPGNVGMTLSYDPHCGERIRDFGDTIGIMSRAVVEGLFGVVPDALSGKLRLRPGWPSEWEKVSFLHPSISYRFERQGAEDRYSIEPKFGKPMQVELEVAARGTGVEARVNGRSAQVRNVDAAVGCPRIVVEAGAAERTEIVLSWRGASPSVASAPNVVACGDKLDVATGRAGLQDIIDPQQALADVKRQQQGFSARAGAVPGTQTVFAKVQEGEWIWWMPIAFESRPALEIVTGYNSLETPRDEHGGLRFRLRNNTAVEIKGEGQVRVGEWQGKLALSVPALGESEELRVTPAKLLPGRQNLRVEAAGRAAEGVVANWGVKAAAVHCRSVDLDGIYNDGVTEIFKSGKYISPALPPCSLGVPTSGIGHWCRPKMAAGIKIDDSGLRKKAAGQGGAFVLACGVPFKIPTESAAKNVAFVSQWDTFPKELTVPLTGHARHVYLLMAGSTYHMQSRLENGEVVVAYVDGTVERLSLRNPETWWPIERDYFVDDYAFRIQAPRPPRIRLNTGEEYFKNAMADTESSVSGGAATVLDLPLDTGKELKSLTVRAKANEVVVGLMGVTLVNAP